jgi:hypothetical protein
MENDGLNTLAYSVSGKEEQPLCTRIFVDINGPKNITEMNEFIAKSINPKLGQEPERQSDQRKPSPEIKGYVTVHLKLYPLGEKKIVSHYLAGDYFSARKKNQ